ncbi:unnamed protein product [Leuciscus chuanchicus]
MEIPAISLKAIVLVHWILTVWACLNPWLPTSYVLGNVSVLAVGVWAIAQRDSIDAVLLFLIGLAVTILTDIVHFGLYYGMTANISDLFRFSAGMAILSLVLKPVSCFFVYQMYRERGGEYNISFALALADGDCPHCELVIAYGDSEDSTGILLRDCSSDPHPQPPTCNPQSLPVRPLALPAWGTIPVLPLFEPRKPRRSQGMSGAGGHGASFLSPSVQAAQTAPLTGRLEADGRG